MYKITIKSLSIAMGIRRLGFQLLSLSRNTHRKIRLVRRVMQMNCVYCQTKWCFTVYVPLSLLVLFLVNRAPKGCYDIKFVSSGRKAPLDLVPPKLSMTTRRDDIRGPPLSSCDEASEFDLLPKAVNNGRARKSHLRPTLFRWQTKLKLYGVIQLPMVNPSWVFIRQRRVRSRLLRSILVGCCGCCAVFHRHVYIGSGLGAANTSLPRTCDGI